MKKLSVISSDALDDQVHDAMTLASSVAFSAGLIENTLEHVSICD